MSAQLTFNLLKLILSLSKDRTITKPIIETKPEKFKVRTKEDDLVIFDDGLKDKYDSFISECETDDSIYLNRMLIHHDGKLVYKYAKEPYDLNSYNYCFSLTKSIIGLGIGLLYDEKKIKLNDKVYKIFFPHSIPTNLNSTKITVKHLLTMSTGSKFNEASSAVSKEWIKDFFNEGNKFKIGTGFDYNSINSYILSALIDKLSGTTIEEYLKTKLFNPLDITDYIFEKSPEGIEKGGWGIYLSPYDMAKFGLLIENNGLYNNKRIVSEKWINMMTDSQNPVKMKGQDYDYGYQIWTNKENNIVQLNGLFNQDVIIYKNTGYVITICCANNDCFHTNNILNIAKKYFNTLEDIKYPYFRKNNEYSDSSLMPLISPLFNNKYELKKNKQGYDTTILPIVIQTCLNEYSTGLKSINIKENKKDYSIKFKEEKESYSINFNFDNYTRQILNLYGNTYDVSVKGYLRMEDSSECYLLIKVAFLEFASVRYLKISKVASKDEIELRFKENPGLNFMESLIYIQDQKTIKFIEKTTNRIGEENVLNKVTDFLYPYLRMTLKNKK